MKYFVNEKELKRNKKISYVLFILGVFTLIMEILFDYKFGNIIWAEVIDILAWVLLWGSVDISLFENRRLKILKNHYLSYIEMKIEYLELKD